MREDDRERFDELVMQVIENLPAPLRSLLEEIPVIVEDQPAPDVLRELGLDESDADELCGLHTGVAMTERSVEESARLPTDIRLYRAGILALAGGWESTRILIEIRLTLLHEIGHHFGLDEQDLANLGYQ